MYLLPLWAVWVHGGHKLCQGQCKLTLGGQCCLCGCFVLSKFDAGAGKAMGTGGFGALLVHIGK